MLCSPAATLFFRESLLSFCDSFPLRKFGRLKALGGLWGELSAFRNSALWQKAAQFSSFVLRQTDFAETVLEPTLLPSHIADSLFTKER